MPHHNVAPPTIVGDAGAGTIRRSCRDTFSSPSQAGGYLGSGRRKSLTLYVLHPGWPVAALCNAIVHKRARIRIRELDSLWRIVGGSYTIFRNYSFVPLLFFATWGAVNEVPGVATCACLTFLDWLYCATGKEAEPSSDCIRISRSCDSPVSGCDKTSKFGSDGN